MEIPEITLNFMCVTYRRNFRNDNYERGRIRYRDKQYSHNTGRNDRSNSTSKSVSRASTNRGQIKVEVEEESEQIQQIYNMDKEETTLKLLVTDTFDSLNRINLIDEKAMDHLN